MYILLFGFSSRFFLFCFIFTLSHRGEFSHCICAAAGETDKSSIKCQGLSFFLTNIEILYTNWESA